MRVRDGSAPDWWLDVCASAFVPMRVSTRRPQGEIQSLDMQGVSVSRLLGGEGEFTRTVQLIDSQPRAAVLLSVALEGSLHVSVQNSATVGQSAICLSDRPYAIGAESSLDVVTIKVPVGRLHVLPSSLDDRHGRPVADGRVRHVELLRDFMLSVLDCNPVEAAERRVLASVAIDLLSLVLRDADEISPGARLRRQDTFDIATTVIAQRSPDPGLTIDAVARECQVSRRELELAFASHGAAPAAYLRRTRLERALRLLDDGAGMASISTIAHEVGFSDVTTFIRAFRRTYNTTPHAWRTQQQTA